MKKEKWWGSTFSFSPETRCSPIAEELTETEEMNPPGMPLILQQAKPQYAAHNSAPLNISSFHQEVLHFPLNIHNTTAPATTIVEHTNMSWQSN